MRRKGKLEKRKIRPVELEPKVGTLYRNIARKRLMAGGTTESVYEVDEMLAGCKYGTIETYVNLEPLIQLSYEQLNTVLAKYKITLPHDFVDVVLHSEWPEDDLEEITIGVNLLNLSELMKCVVALKTLRGIHDEWVKRNVDKFGDGGVRERMQFMPFCLIGEQGVREWYALVEDILTVLWLAPDDDDFLLEYYNSWRNFVLDQNRVFLERDVVEMMTNFSPEAIVQKLREDDGWARVILREVIERM